MKRELTSANKENAGENTRDYLRSSGQILKTICIYKSRAGEGVERQECHVAGDCPGWPRGSSNGVVPSYFDSHSL